MKAKVLVLLAVQLALAQTTVGLKDVYSSYFKFGSILNGTTVNSTAMKNIVLKEFNSITPENELKPDQTLVQNGSTNTDIKVQLGNGAKNILKFCEDNEIPVRGHTLVWHSQTPQWFFKDNFQNSGNWVTPAVMDQRMESYIKNMFELIKSSYPNLNLYAYDVVNEAASENGSWRTGGSDAGGGQSMWVQVYGNNSFVEKAFTYARKYAPATTKLFYNDYNEYITAKMNYIASSIVKPLYDKGLLDGMGMQSHLDVRNGNDAYPSASTYGTAITKYKDIGVEIHVTELDATVNNSNFTAQATYYKDIMNQIITKGGKAVTAVVVWGIQDDQSWRKEGSPLLFDASGNKKAAYNSVVSLVPESEWGKPASSSSVGGTSSSSRPSSSSGTPPTQATNCNNFIGTLPANPNPPSNPYTACFKHTNNKCYVCKVENESSTNTCSSTWVWNGNNVDDNLALGTDGYWYKEVTCPATSSSSARSSSSAAVSSSSRAASSSSARSSSSAAVSSSSRVASSSSARSSSSVAASSSSRVNSSSSRLASSSSVRSSSSGTTPVLENRIPVTHFSVLPQSNKTLRIEISSPAIVEIFDLKGNKAVSFDVSGTSQTIKLSLPNGVYFAKVHGMKSVRFVLR